MGMILNKSIRKFIKGFPTIGDKYNIFGAELTGSTAVNFGDPLIWDTATANADGYRVKSAIGTSAVSGASAFAGFAVGTNVKLPSDYPATSVQYKAGEALNVLLNGYLAIELDSAVTTSAILPNAKVYITANGVLNLTATNNFDTGFVCTGVWEDHGNSSAHHYIAEVYKA